MKTHLSTLPKAPPPATAPRFLAMQPARHVSPMGLHKHILLAPLFVRAITHFAVKTFVGGCKHGFGRLVLFDADLTPASWNP